MSSSHDTFRAHLRSKRGPGPRLFAHRIPSVFFACCTSTLALLSGCLESNPYFQHKDGEAPHSDDFDDGTTSTDVDDDSGGDASHDGSDPNTEDTSELIPDDTSLPTGTADTPSNSDDSTSDTSDDPTSSTSSEDDSSSTSETTSSDETTSTEETTSSDDSSSSDDTTTTEAEPLAFPLVIDNRSGSRSVPSGYSLLFCVDYPVLESLGANPDGSNLWIRYRNGSNVSNLDRVLDPDSTWNDSCVALWFRTQASVNTGNTSGNAYELVIDDDAAGSPPADPQRVFLLFDDFESGTFNTSLWQYRSDPDAHGSASLQNGRLVARTTSRTSRIGYSTIVSRNAYRETGISLEARLSTQGTGQDDRCGQVQSGSLVNDSYLEQRGFMLAGGIHNFLYYNGSGVAWYRDRNASQQSGSHRYAFDWNGQNSFGRLDGNIINSMAYSNEPDTRSMRAQFGIVDSGACLGANFEASFEWVMVRQNVATGADTYVDLSAVGGRSLRLQADDSRRVLAPIDYKE